MNTASETSRRREITLPPPRTRTHGVLPEKTMSPATRPRCRATYSAHAVILIRIELTPKQESRNTEICPKLNIAGPPGRYGYTSCLRSKETWRNYAFDPKNPPYRLQPLIEMEIKDRLQQHAQPKGQNMEMQDNREIKPCQQEQQQKQTMQR